MDKMVPGARLQLTDAGLRRATMYRYRAEVFNSLGSSGRTNVLGLADPLDRLQLEVETLPLPPSVPRDIRRDSGLDIPVAIGLSWTLPIDDGGREITGYHVWAIDQRTKERVETAMVTIVSAASGTFSRVRARITGLSWSTNHTF